MVSNMQRIKPFRAILFKILSGFAAALLLTGCNAQLTSTVPTSANVFIPTPPPPTPTTVPSIRITATITPSPTPTLHPMNILAARQTPYPGSSITIEETLEPGANYHRYIAGDEAEGLKIYG